MAGAADKVDGRRRPLSDEHRAKISAGKRKSWERKRSEGSEDAAPRSKPRSKKSSGPPSKSGELERIRERLNGLFTAPALVAASKGDQWAVDHFTSRGPALADAIVAECERNHQLRGWMVRLVEVAGSLALLGEVFAYAALPLMHWGVLPFGELFKVPPVSVPRQRGPIAGERPPFIAPREGPASVMQDPSSAAGQGTGYRLEDELEQELAGPRDPMRDGSHSPGREPIEIVAEDGGRQDL